MSEDHNAPATNLAPLTQANGNELAILQAQSTAIATVQARFGLARRFPRSVDEARVSLLRDCARPSFASCAIYERPVGREKNPTTGEWEEKYIRGPSIRFAEAAVQALGNIQSDTVVVEDDDHRRVVRVTATDLERNISYSADVSIAKRIERRSLKKGQRPLGTRTNSYGDTVYIVAAEDSEMAVRVAAEVSKALRTLLLRLIPGWLIDEAVAKINATMAAEDRRDPDEARKRIVDSFASIGVRARDLEEYLRHPLDGASPDELSRLRAIYATIRDDGASWHEIMAALDGEVPEGAKENPLAKALADRMKKRPPAAAPAPQGAPAPAAAPAPQGADTKVVDLVNALKESVDKTKKRAPREPGED